jgi:hypothetical protein
VAFTEKIRVLIDVVSDKATASLKTFKQSVSDADTTTGKFKAGVSSGFDVVKANAGALAVAGGGALIAFGVKAVGAFQETALGAGQLRDSLGVTAEEASRLQEVAGDLGIGVEALESTMGRMNREAANAPGKFDEIGAAIKRNEDGTTNVTETFLSTVDALNKMPDATQRAAAAQEIFGRSWQDISELVAAGADGVREALDSVEQGKIIDDKEVERARRFRDTLDNLKGVAEELAVEVGGSLVDALEDAAPAMQVFAEATGTAIRGVGGLFGVAQSLGTKLGHVFSPWNAGAREANQAFVDAVNDSEKAAAEFDPALLKLAGSFEEARAKAVELGADEHAANLIALEWKATQEALGEEVEGTAKAQEYAADATKELTQVTKLGKDALDAYGRKAHFAADETDNLRNDFAQLKGELSNRSAFLDIANQFDQVERAAAEAFDAASSGAADSTAKSREFEQAVIGLKQKVLDYGGAIAGLPEQTTTDILALIDAGKLDEAERRLNNLSRARDVAIRPQVITTGGARIRVDEFGNVRSYDGGGMVPGATGSAQLAVVHGGEQVLTPEQQRAGGGGGPTISLTINAGMGADPVAIGKQAVKAINAYYRSGGVRIA